MGRLEDRVIIVTGGPMALGVPTVKVWPAKRRVVVADIDGRCGDRGRAECVGKRLWRCRSM